jgi:hypothetical protein
MHFVSDEYLGFETDDNYLIGHVQLKCYLSRKISKKTTIIVVNQDCRRHWYTAFDLTLLLRYLTGPRLIPKVDSSTIQLYERTLAELNREHNQSGYYYLDSNGSHTTNKSSMSRTLRIPTEKFYLAYKDILEQIHFAVFLDTEIRIEPLFLDHRRNFLKRKYNEKTIDDHMEYVRSFTNRVGTNESKKIILRRNLVNEFLMHMPVPSSLLIK